MPFFFSVFPAAVCSPSLKIMSVVSVTVIRLLPAQAALYGRSHGEPCPWTATAPGAPNLELELQGKSKTSLLSQASISSLNGQQEGLLCSDSSVFWQLPTGFAWCPEPRSSPLGSHSPKLNWEHWKDLFCSHRHCQRNVASQILTPMALHVPCEYHVRARLIFLSL